MPTHLECAQLSKQVYFNNGGFLMGWKCTQFFEDKKNGLAIGVYEKASTNEMVIAFRGTDTKNFNNFIQNFFSDYHIFVGEYPNTAPPAIEFVKKTRGSRNSLSRLSSILLSFFKTNQLTLTGHSLGGALAMAVGLFFARENKSYKIVTLENSGIGHLITSEDYKKLANLFNQNFITYLADPNPINTLHPHIGEIRHLRLPLYSDMISKGGYYKKHVWECASSEFLRIIFCGFMLDLILDALKIESIPDQLMNSMILFLYHWFGYADNESISEYKNFILIAGLILITLYQGFSESSQLIGQQHPINALIPSFEKGEGEAFSYNKMKQWPHTFYAGFWKNTIKRLIPFRNDTPGLLTLLSPQEMREKEIENMEGYEIEKKITLK